MASKAVLITGCSTGIGRKTAEHLASKEWTVYATARRPESVADLEAKGCKTLALDVTDEESMQAAVRAVEEAEGAVGVLINNAGYSQSGAVEEVPMEQVRRQFDTNVFGLLRMCQLVLPGMRRQGWGRIVNISSMGGRLVFPGGGIYHGTKFAVEAISDAMRWEVRGFGVDVILIEPGLIKTEFGETAAHSVNDATPTNGPYAEFNQLVASATVGAYEGRAATGPDGRQADREGDLPRAAAHALPHHRGSAGAPRRPAATAGPRLGRDDADSVQAAASVARRSDTARGLTCWRTPCDRRVGRARALAGSVSPMAV